MPDRFKLVSEVHLLLVRHDEILLLRRFQTGYEDGNYGVVSGHVDGSEPARRATAREAFEEVGLQVSPDDISFLYLQHRFSEDGSVWTDVFFDAGDWHGEPINAEPEKHSDIGWIDSRYLPDEVMPYQKYALERIAEGKMYGEWGWQDFAK